MSFVDSNIPMYLVGAAHPNKISSQHILEQCIAQNHRLVTDVEVFQEILHRYGAIARRDAIQPAFEALSGVIDEVLPVEHRDILRAKDIMLATDALSARDALHLAVMDRHGIKKILSFDKAFDVYPGISRITNRP